MIVDEADWNAPKHGRKEDGQPQRPALVGMVVRYEETALRDKVKDAGGRWDQFRKVWVLPLPVATQLSLEQRFVALPDDYVPPPLKRPVRTMPDE